MGAKDSVKKAEEKGLSKYFRGVRSEFKKVVWPTKKEILNYSTIVIVVSIAFSILLEFYDKILELFFGNFIYG